MRQVFAALVVAFFASAGAHVATADAIQDCRRSKTASDKIEFCSRAIAVNRRSDILERAYLRRGNAFVELGNHQRAVDDFSALIAINPRIAGYFDNRLQAYRSLGRFADALEDANRSVRMASGEAFAYRSRGLVYADMSRIDLAVSDFNTAISFDSGNAGLYIDRGRLHVRANRLRDAVNDFARALQLDGRAMDAYRERGLALMRLGDTGGAMADLILFSRAQPGDLEVARAMEELQAERAAPQPRQAERAPESSERKTSSGTGFFISDDGYLVSNAHVVEGCARAQVRYGLSAFHDANVVARDSTNDLAVLKTDIKPQTASTLRAGVRVGETVAAYGYPLAGLLASGGNFTTGNISATAGLGDDTRFLQISAPVQPGNSGGPVLDQSGNVVGVVVAKLDALKFAKLTDDVPQNVNFAIKATVLVNFLETTGLAYATAGIGTGLASADLAERGKAISALVICRP